MALTRCHACGKLANTKYACKVCGSNRHVESETAWPFPPIPLEDRKAYAEKPPWVKRLRKKTQCDGWMSHGKCKKPAEWSYRWTSSRYWRNPQKRQHFCWSHLWSRGFHGDMQEEMRWERWMKDNPPPWWTEERQRALDELNARTQVPESTEVQSDASGGASNE